MENFFSCTPRGLQNKKRKGRRLFFSFQVYFMWLISIFSQKTLDQILRRFRRHNLASVLYFKHVWIFQALPRKIHYGVKKYAILVSLRDPKIDAFSYAVLALVLNFVFSLIQLLTQFTRNQLISIATIDNFYERPNIFL